jgi:hypothetical protein
MSGSFETPTVEAEGAMRHALKAKLVMVSQTADLAVCKMMRSFCLAAAAAAADVGRWHWHASRE